MERRDAVKKKPAVVPQDEGWQDITNEWTSVATGEDASGWQDITQQHLNKGQPAPTPTAQEQPSIAERFLGRGVWDETKDIVSGTLDMAKTLARPPERGEPYLPLMPGLKDIIGTVAGESARSAGEAYEGWKAGDLDRLAKGGVGAIPMVGPLINHLVERFQEDPVAGAGALVPNIASMFIGPKMTKAAPKAAPAPARPIPGANQFFVESLPPTILKKMGESASRAPSAYSLVDRFLRPRDEAITGALKGVLDEIAPDTGATRTSVGSTLKDQLVENIQTTRRVQDAQTMADAAQMTAAPGGTLPTTEKAGKAIQSALKRRATSQDPPATTPQGGRPPSVRDIEASLWEPFKAQMDDLLPDTSGISEAAKNVAQTSKEAQSAIISNLPPSIQKIVERAAGLSNEPTIPPEYVNLPPQAQALLLQEMQTAGIGTAQPPTFRALHASRGEIDRIMSSQGDRLGKPGKRALTLLRKAITEALEATVMETNPALMADFKKASAMTRYKFKSTETGITGDIIGKAIPPSEIVGKLIVANIEEARRFKNAIGADAMMRPEMQTAFRREILKKHTKPGKGGQSAVDWESLGHDVRNNPVYRELLGNRNYTNLVDEVEFKVRAGRTPAAQRQTDAMKIRDQIAGESPENTVNRLLKPGASTDMADVVRALPPQTRRNVQRVGMEKLIDDATAPTGLLDGPKFSDLWQSHRSVFEAAGIKPETLAHMDDIANQIKGYTLSSGTGKASSGAVWEKGVLASGAVGAATSLLSGNPALAATSLGAAGAMVFAPRALLRIMLEPAGPKLLSRYFKTGQITPELRRMIGAGIASGPMAAQWPLNTKDDSGE